jgi:hypothetical protein
MAVQTIYLLAQAGVTPNFFGPTQLNGSAPTAANTAYGWAVSTTAITTPYRRGRLGATAVGGDAAVASSYNAAASGPTKGTGTGAAAAGDSFVAGPFTGTFAAGAWTFNFNLRASTVGAVGHINLRLWKSANADGTGATQLLANTAGATVTLSTTADVNSSISTSAIGLLPLSNEYLFFQVEWQETTAGSSSTSNVLFRAGTAAIVTPNFAASKLLTSITTGTPRNDLGGCYGVQFTPSTTMVFNKIGIRAGALGLTAPRMVSIQNDATTVELARALVDISAATSVDQFFYADIPQITLSAGVVYDLWGLEQPGDGHSVWNQTPVVLRDCSSYLSTYNWTGYAGAAGLASYSYTGVDLDYGTPTTVLVAGQDYFDIAAAGTANLSFTQDRLTAYVQVISTASYCRSHISHAAGKWHVEFTSTTLSASTHSCLGFATAFIDFSANDQVGIIFTSGYAAIRVGGTDVLTLPSTFYKSSSVNPTVDRVAIEVDFDAKTLRANNLTSGSGWSAAADISTLVGGPWFVAATHVANCNVIDQDNVNFGATPFALTPSAGYAGWAPFSTLGWDHDLWDAGLWDSTGAVNAHGALTAQAAHVVGTARASSASTKGVLAAQAAHMTGAAVSMAVDTGALVAGAAHVAGTARSSSASTKGVLAAQAAHVAGVGAELSSSTKGVLAAQAAHLAGAAVASSGSTKGVLAAQVAHIVGTARSSSSSTKGVLTAQAAHVAGTANVLLANSGSLLGRAAHVAGAATSSSGSTRGVLTAQPAHVAGTARSSSGSTGGTLTAQAAHVAGAAAVLSATAAASGILLAQRAHVAGAAAVLSATAAANGILLAQPARIAGLAQVATGLPTANGVLRAQPARVAGAALVSGLVPPMPPPGALRFGVRVYVPRRW